MRHEQRSINTLMVNDVVKRQAAPLALTGAANTLTAAGMTGGLVTVNGGTAGAVTTTLATAALLDTALTALTGEPFPVDYSIDFSVINLSTVAAEDATVTTATGWTLVGEMVVDANEATQVLPSSATFRARKTGAGAYSLYRIG